MIPAADDKYVSRTRKCIDCRSMGDSLMESRCTRFQFDRDYELLSLQPSDNASVSRTSQERLKEMIA